MIVLLKALFLFPVYYWKHRIQIWESFIDEIPFMHRPTQDREIWLSADRSRRNDRWDVNLPKRCVVCGTYGASYPETATHTVDDYSSPALLVFLGLTSGGLAGRYWRLWAFPLFIYAGFVAGMIFTTRNEVKITYYRCPQHAGDRRFPRIRLFGNHLIVRIGNKELRKDFREPELKT